MENIYWIEEWAKIRQDEVVRIPEKISIHESFLKHISKANLENTFKEIWNMYISIYNDIAKYPESFNMPLYKINDYNYFTTQARDSRNAAYLPFNFLYNLLISGDFHNGFFTIDLIKFKSINKLKNIHIYFERLIDYGFVFNGLKNFKIASVELFISYPDNENILYVLKLLADKARCTNRVNDFYCCHYKLFQDDMNTANYGYGADVVADKMHTIEERDFIYELDTILSKQGYFSKLKAWNEGPGYAYYDNQNVMLKNGPYHYWILSWKTSLVLYLRIRNASKCLDYLKQCPATVKEIFLKSDEGCKNRLNGSCQYGQEYTIDGTTYWRCGCASAPFYFKPKKDDIYHYIKLVELGLKK